MLKRLNPIITCFLFSLLATYSAHTVAEPVPAPKPISRLPEDWTIDARAPTLDALIQKTHPILQFKDSYDHPILVWTGMTASGGRFFQLTSAQPCQPKGHALEWITAHANNDEARLNCDDLLLTRITVNVGTGMPKDSFVFTENWAHLVAADPHAGTLYEVEFYYWLTGEGTWGQRAMLLQDTNQTWHFVSLLQGNFWDDTGEIMKTHVSAQFTGHTREPLRLVVRYVEEQDLSDNHDGKVKPLVTTFEEQYTGQLPLVKPLAPRCYVVVKRGETFSGIIKAISTADVNGQGEAARKILARALTTEILKLNSSLNIDHVTAGQQIEIPTPTARKTLANKFGQ